MNPFRRTKPVNIADFVPKSELDITVLCALVCIKREHDRLVDSWRIESATPMQLVEHAEMHRATKTLKSVLNIVDTGRV